MQLSTRACPAPGIDASRAGQQALEMYDKNHDGVISGDELDQAPALKEALSKLDTNGDKAVSGDEIAARVKAWQATQIGVTSVRCHVSLDGEPLEGATVTFEPESYLGTEIKSAVGVTSAFGDTSPAIPKEQALTRARAAACIWVSTKSASRKL